MPFVLEFTSPGEEACIDQGLANKGSMSGQGISFAAARFLCGGGGGGGMCCSFLFAVILFRGGGGVTRGSSAFAGNVYI